MSGRIFAYLRVSTATQTTDNQILSISNAGYDVKLNRIISETISGSVTASQRPAFSKLLEKLESGDTLIVNKLDRLGRDNIDVQQTINTLLSRGVIPIALDLPNKDLSKAEGQLILKMFAAFAEFERDRIRERSIEGQARARAEGKSIGRPNGTKNKDRVLELQTKGLKQTEIAEALAVSIRTVQNHWSKEVTQKKVEGFTQ